MAHPYKGIFMMLGAAFMAAGGQLFFKIAGGFAPSLYFAAGVLFYAIGAILMIYAYRFGKLSALSPVLASGYVFALFLGAIFLKEEITLPKIVAVILIFAGVSLLGKSHD